MKNLRFIRLLIKLKLSHMMLFRLSFFGSFFADASLFIVQLSAFQLIYGQVESVGGWSRGQMLIFIGTISMISGLNTLIFFFGIAGIPNKIREGVLDYYIAKPMSALLRLTFESVDPGSIPLLLLSGAIIAYGIDVAGVHITVPLMLLYTILVLMMTLLWYDMEVILRTLSFFFFVVSDIDPIERVEGTLLSLNFKIPGVIYRGFFKVLFYFILPYGIMATIPTQALTGALSPGGFLHTIGIVIFFTAFALWFWRFGVKHYKSASS